MAGDARFWELPFDPGDFDAFEAIEFDATELHPAKAEMLNALGELVRTSLTDKQRAIVELYFYEQRTQEEIAAALGVSQQVVSRQLFGVIREGKRIGGAVQRLRKACAELGLDPSQWV